MSERAKRQADGELVDSRPGIDMHIAALRESPPGRCSNCSTSRRSGGPDDHSHGNAQVSTGFDRIEGLDDAIPVGEFEREPLPYEAGFVAGKAFLAYRKRGGQRRSPLPDFYIGAHAAIRGYRLLTRDVARYRTYFPRVELIAP